MDELLKENLEYELSAAISFILAIGGAIVALISFLFQKWLLMTLGIVLVILVIVYFIHYGKKHKIPFFVKKVKNRKTGEVK